MRCAKKIDLGIGQDFAQKDKSPAAMRQPDFLKMDQ